MEEKILEMVDSKVAEHNTISRLLNYLDSTSKIDYYKGRLTELQNVLLDFAWRFDIKVSFYDDKDSNGRRYEKAVAESR